MGIYGYTEKIVISLGGSLIVPEDGIDIKFLINFNNFIRKQLVDYKNRQFFFVVGVGQLLESIGMQVVTLLVMNSHQTTWIG